MKRSAVVLCLLLMAFIPMSLGQSISTQGVLRDSDGHSVEDGDYSMTFSIYDTEAGGTLLWGPTTKTVMVENGIYHVILGETTPITSFNGDGANYLQISVEGEAMTPRLRLNVSPYELAQLSGSSNVVPGSGNVGVGTTNPQAKLSIVVPGDNGDLLHFDEDSDNQKEFTFQGMFAGTGSSGNALKLRSQWIDKIMFWRGDGRVGIGTNDPQATLDVVGAVQASSNIGNRSSNIGQAMEVGTTAQTTLRFDSDSYRIYAGGTGASGTAVTVLENGNVGIGVTSPSVPLQVDGGTDAEPGQGGYIQVGPNSSTNLAMDDNEIMARNNGSTSTLYLNNSGGSVVVGGTADIKGDVNVQHGSNYLKPFQFVKYTGSGEDLTITTTYSATDWIAAITGFDAGYGDIDEGGSMDLWQINAFVEGGVWKIFADAPTHNNGPDWDIYVMFVSTKIGYATAGYKAN